MTWNLFYYDEVTNDLRQAKKWYKSRQEGLDKRFAEDVKVSIERLHKNPVHYEIKYDNIRVVYCDVFPYSIHFYIDEPGKRLVIVAILHQHRDPDLPSSRKLS